MGYDTTIIEEIRFTNRTFGGYDTDEVDEFLDELVIEIENLNRQIETLSAQLKDAKSAGPAVAEETKAVIEEIKQEPKEVPAYTPPPLPVQSADNNDEIKKMKEILSDTLVTAQKTADQVINTAKKEAEKIIVTTQEKSTAALHTVTKQLEQAEVELSTIHELAYSAKEQYIKDFSLQIRNLEAIKIGNNPYKQKDEDIKAKESNNSESAPVANNEKYIQQALSAYDINDTTDAPSSRSSLVFEVPKDLAETKTEKPMLSSVIEGILNNNDNKE